MRFWHRAKQRFAVHRTWPTLTPPTVPPNGPPVFDERTTAIASTNPPLGPDEREAPDLAAASIHLLRSSGVRLEPGLSDSEVARVQNRFGFAFGPEHLQFIQSAMPVGESWPDWRKDSDAALRERLDWPIESVLFDVHESGFWPNSSGERPDAPGQREAIARVHLARVPALVPIYSHRFLTSAPHHRPSPVFSVYQTDVIYYGDNLLDYVAHEFGVAPPHPSDRLHVPFWSDLADGADDQDL